MCTRAIDRYLCFARSPRLAMITIITGQHRLSTEINHAQPPISSSVISMRNLDVDELLLTIGSDDIIVGFMMNDEIGAQITADTITDEQIRELRATCVPFPLDGNAVDVCCDMALGVYPPPPWLTEEEAARDRRAARVRCAEIYAFRKSPEILNARKESK